MTAAVAVDVGGTKIRAGSVIDGRLAHVRSVPTPATAGAQAVLDTIAEVAATVIAETSGSGGADSAWRIGVGAAGVIDPATGVVVSATDSLTGWAGTDLVSELSARTGLHVRAVNDVHAHALGESFAGASRGTRSSLLVAAGTGIGGGFIADGRLLTGRNSAAGHIGHVPSAAAAGLDCPCGGTGHVEAIASGPAILATYQRLIGRDDSPTSAPAPESNPAPVPANTRELAAAASAGDPLAVRSFDMGARALGSALGGIANILSPEVIVIGGGLAEMDETWWTPLRAAFAAELIPATAGAPLVKAELGQDAALIGAASLWDDEPGRKKETH
ncbi:ROK family protein [Brevibacterium sp. S22]|nr:ROK family protein [Brevibacterium sp. S22]